MKTFIKLLIWYIELGYIFILFIAILVYYIKNDKVCLYDLPFALLILFLLFLLLHYLIK